MPISLRLNAPAVHISLTTALGLSTLCGSKAKSAKKHATFLTHDATCRKCLGVFEAHATPEMLASHRGLVAATIRADEAAKKSAAPKRAAKTTKKAAPAFPFVDQFDLAEQTGKHVQEISPVTEAIGLETKAQAKARRARARRAARKSPK